MMYKNIIINIKDHKTRQAVTTIRNKMKESRENFLIHSTPLSKRDFKSQSVKRRNSSFYRRQKKVFYF
jgi:hypothetical protein